MNRGAFSLGVSTLLSIIGMVAGGVYIIEQQIAGAQSAAAVATQKVDDVDIRLTRIENKIDDLTSYVAPRRLASTTSER